MKHFIQRAMPVALGLAALSGAGWAQNVSCGLNNGKAATGEPLPIGAVVGNWL